MRSRVARLTAAAALGSVLLAAPVSAATKRVDVVDVRFMPASTSIRVGDVVRWVSNNTGEDHNVREDNRIFRSGSLSYNIDYSRRFSAGTFRYFCESHSFNGMRGVVKVPVAISGAPAGPTFTVRWAVRGTQTGSRYDVDYRVGSGEWRRWKSGTSLKAAEFGDNTAPVRVAMGKRYSFRTRSKTSYAHSAWSPVRTFVP